MKVYLETKTAEQLYGGNSKKFAYNYDASKKQDIEDTLTKLNPLLQGRKSEERSLIRAFFKANFNKIVEIMKEHP